MAFTYDPTTDLGKARLYLGDIDVAVALFQDAEYNALLTAGYSPLKTASTLARTLAAKYGRLVSQSIDGASFSYGERAQFYMDLAVQLEGQAGIAGTLGVPFVSGVSKEAMRTVDDDTDRTPSNFKIGMHDDVSG
jgi:hypothetical protein